MAKIQLSTANSNALRHCEITSPVDLSYTSKDFASQKTFVFATCQGLEFSRDRKICLKWNYSRTFGPDLHFILGYCTMEGSS